MSRSSRYFYPAGFLLICVGVWEILCRVFNIPEYLLPAPSAVIRAILEVQSQLLHHMLVTDYEALLGYAIGISIGIVLAFAFELSRKVELSVSPYVVFLKIVPTTAIAPFLVIWFGNGIASKVAAATIMTIFPVVVASTKGLQEIDGNMLNLFRSLGASRMQLLVKAKLPNAIPHIFTGLRIGIASAFAGAVIAEFIAANKGLGFLILTNFYYLKTSTMFAALVCLMLNGIIFYGLVVLVERTILSKFALRPKLR
jgi:NitT/TauT family transport system permease protein